MATSKKKLKLYHATEEATEPADLVGTTVPCPQHGPDHVLTIEKDDATFFGICRCNVRNNMWTGKRVWERALDLQTPVVEETTEGE